MEDNLFSFAQYSYSPFERVQKRGERVPKRKGLQRCQGNCNFISGVPANFEHNSTATAAGTAFMGSITI